MWRLIVPAAIASETLPADIIRHNENEVGRTLCRRKRSGRAGDCGKGKQNCGNGRRWPNWEGAIAGATARCRFENHKKHPLFMQIILPNRNGEFGGECKEWTMERSRVADENRFPRRKSSPQNDVQTTKSPIGLSFFCRSGIFVSKFPSRIQNEKPLQIFLKRLAKQDIIPFYFCR